MFSNIIILNIPTIYFYIKLFIIACSYMVVTSRNPIYSILFLILVFGFTSVLFIFLNIDFFALILIIIYLGAVCVLFLFVMMMLNIKLLEIKRQINFIPFIFVILAFIFFFLFINSDISSFLTTRIFKIPTENFDFGNIEKNSFSLKYIHGLIDDLSYFINSHSFSFNFTNFIWFDNYQFFLFKEIFNFPDYFLFVENKNVWTLDNLKSLGLILYNFFSIQFILSGLILFIAMMGAIFLTLELYIKSKRQNFFNQISRNKSFLK